MSAFSSGTMQRILQNSPLAARPNGHSTGTSPRSHSPGRTMIPVLRKRTTGAFKQDWEGITRAFSFDLDTASTVKNPFVDTPDTATMKRSPLRQVTNQEPDLSPFMRAVHRARPPIPDFNPPSEPNDNKEPLKITLHQAAGNISRASEAKGPSRKKSRNSTSKAATSKQPGRKVLWETHSDAGSRGSHDGSESGPNTPADGRPKKTRKSTQRSLLLKPRTVSWKDPTDVLAAATVRESTVICEDSDRPCLLVAFANALILTTPTSRIPGPIEEVLPRLEGHPRDDQVRALIVAVVEELEQRANKMDAREEISALLYWAEEKPVNLRMVKEFDGEALGAFGKNRPFDSFCSVASAAGIPILHGLLADPANEELDKAIKTTCITSTELASDLEVRFQVGQRDQGRELECIDSWLAENPLMITEYGIEKVKEELGLSKVGILYYGGHFTTVITCTGVSEPKTLRAAVKGGDFDKYVAVLVNSLDTKLFELETAPITPEIVWKEVASRGPFNCFNGDFDKISAVDSSRRSISDFDFLEPAWRAYFGTKKHVRELIARRRASPELAENGKVGAGKPLMPPPKHSAEAFNNLTEKRRQVEEVYANTLQRLKELALADEMGRNGGWQITASMQRTSIPGGQTSVPPVNQYRSASRSPLAWQEQGGAGIMQPPPFQQYQRPQPVYNSPPSQRGIANGRNGGLSRLGYVGGQQYGTPEFSRHTEHYGRNNQYHNPPRRQQHQPQSLHGPFHPQLAEMSNFQRPSPQPQAAHRAQIHAPMERQGQSPLHYGRPPLPEAWRGSNVSPPPLPLPSRQQNMAPQQVFNNHVMPMPFPQSPAFERPMQQHNTFHHLPRPTPFQEMPPMIPQIPMGPMPPMSMPMPQMPMGPFPFMMHPEGGMPPNFGLPLPMPHFTMHGTPHGFHRGPQFNHPPPLAPTPGANRRPKTADEIAMEVAQKYMTGVKKPKPLVPTASELEGKDGKSPKLKDFWRAPEKKNVTLRHPSSDTFIDFHRYDTIRRSFDADHNPDTVIERTNAWRDATAAADDGKTEDPQAQASEVPGEGKTEAEPDLEI